LIITEIFVESHTKAMTFFQFCDFAFMKQKYLKNILFY